MTLTAGSLFSGMGGFASGLRAAGFDLRWANDNNVHACAALRFRFPGLPVFEKVRDFSVERDGLAPVDSSSATVTTSRRRPFRSSAHSPLRFPFS